MIIYFGMNLLYSGIFGIKSETPENVFTKQTSFFPNK